MRLPRNLAGFLVLAGALVAYGGAETDHNRPETSEAIQRESDIPQASVDSHMGVLETDASKGEVISNATESVRGGKTTTMIQ